MDHIAAPTHAQFAENLNSKFHIQFEDDTTVDLELIEVSELKSTPRQERFWVLFRGPLDFYLAQRSYRVDHDVLGSHDFFLVPVSQQQDGFRYELIFNLLKDRV
jgi:uncharacterized protein DUF6916